VASECEPAVRSSMMFDASLPDRQAQPPARGRHASSRPLRLLPRGAMVQPSQGTCRAITRASFRSLPPSPALQPTAIELGVGAPNYYLAARPIPQKPVMLVSLATGERSGHRTRNIT
jgi:hypothetical protein